jgi:hypothetical protein
MTETRQIMCANEDHARPAVARLSWPCGRFDPTFACREDAALQQRIAIAEGYTLLVEPIEIRERPKGPRDYAPAVREVGKLYRAAYGQPLPAILLHAPDHPSYDVLPDTIEERRKLPARFHTPHWMGDCTPTAWVCNVCWTEGVTYGWPCEVAAEHGGEVFAR